MKNVKGNSNNEVWLDTVIYLVTGILQKAGGFLLLPVLIASLPPADFTRYGLFISLMHLLAKGASLSLQSAPTRLVFDYDRVSEQASLLRTTLWTAVAVSGAGMMILTLCLTFSGVTDSVTRGSFIMMLLIMSSVLGTIAVDHSLALFRVYRQPRLFSAISIVKSIGPVVLYILIIYIVESKFEIIVFAYACVLTVVGGGALFITRSRRTEGVFSTNMAWKSIYFSSPIMVSFITLWIVSKSGRWIGTWFIELDQLADYTLLTFIIAGAGMVGRSLFDARIPSIGNAFADGEIYRGKRIIRNVTGISIGLVVLGYCAAFIITNNYGHHIPEAYRPTNTLLSIAFMASLFDCLYLHGHQSLVALKHTEMLPVATGSGAVAVVALSLLLTYLFGPIGLVAAMATGYFIQACAAVLLVRHVYKSISVAG